MEKALLVMELIAFTLLAIFIFYSLITMIIDKIQAKREAREFISNGAVKVNGEKINDLSFVIRKENSLQGGYIFLKRGKKLYAALKF